MLQTGNSAGLTYSSLLATAVKQVRVYDPDWATLSDLEIWDKIRRDPVVLGVFQRRTARIAGTPWRILPASEKPEDEKLASIVDDALQSIEDLTQVRTAACDAILRGSSWQWLEWKKQRCCLGGVSAEWFVPVNAHDVDKFRFELRNVEGKLRWHMYSLDARDFRLLSDEQHANFLRVVYRDSEDALGYGRGLLEAIYQYLYWRNELIQKILSWADRTAFGVPVAKVRGLRRGSTGKENDEVQQAWINMLSALRTQHVAAIDAEEDIEFLTGGGQDFGPVLQTIEYFDRAITQLLAGGQLQGGSLTGGDAGSLAQAEVHRQSEGDLVELDRQKIDRAVSRDVIGSFLRHNAPILAFSGLGGAKPPRFTTAQEAVEDRAGAAAIATQLLDRGVPLKKDELYERTGWTPPAPGDAVVHGVAAGGLGLRPESSGAEEDGVAVEGSSGSPPGSGDADVRTPSPESPPPGVLPGA